MMAKIRIKNIRLYRTLLHRLISSYLKRECKVSQNLKNQYFLKKNIVSGKYIIIPNFSESISSNEELKLSLHNFIQHINHTITISDLRKELYSLNNGYNTTTI